MTTLTRIFAASVALIHMSRFQRPADYAGSDSIAAKQMMRVELNWIKAIRTGNVRLLREILAPDFMDVAWNGELRNRDSMLADLGKPARRKQESKFGQWSVRTFGNAGVVRGLNTISTRRFGTVRLRFTDVFVKRGGVWRAVDAQETLVRRSLK